MLLIVYNNKIRFLSYWSLLSLFFRLLFLRLLFLGLLLLWLFFFRLLFLCLLLLWLLLLFWLLFWFSVHCLYFREVWIDACQCLELNWSCIYLFIILSKCKFLIKWLLRIRRYNFIQRNFNPSNLCLIIHHNYLTYLNRFWYIKC